MSRTIYSNYDLDEMYEDAKDYLVDELGIEEPSDTQIWNEVYRNDELNWEDEKYELERFFNDKYCIFVGSVGRWNGTYAGGKIGRFWELFHSALKDCAYFSITDEDGHLYINGSHHDGNVSFEVKILTDKGYDYSENWAYGYSKQYDYSEAEMHTRIMKCSFLSRLPHFWKKVYDI